MSESNGCPCGSGVLLDDCCGCYITGSPALSADHLMRSRYTAYVMKNEAYLLATWHASTRPLQLDLDADATHWLGLKLINYQLQDDNHALVEFVARYKIAGRAHRLHEVSQFVLEHGRWFYLDGVLR
ncbi:MAG: YchJ family metal-binding protein [Sulfuriferula sp.]